MASKRKRTTAAAPTKARKGTKKGTKKTAVRAVAGPRRVAVAKDARAADDIKDQQVEMTPEDMDTVRAISSAWARNVPMTAASSGAHDVEAARLAPRDPPALGPTAKDVPAGRYRVEGHDWILTIEGGEVTHFEKGQPDTDPSEYISVPAALPNR